MIETILVAVDDSRAAFRAADEAIELAGRLGARLVAVTVLDDVAAEAPARAPARSHPAPPRDRGPAAVGAVLRRVHDNAVGAGVDVELCTARGHVADTLLDEVRRVRADLVVIGRVDRPEVRLTHVGRTAEQVLEFSEVPVLVVPAARG